MTVVGSIHTKRLMNDFKDKTGGKTNVTVIYGTSETGALTVLIDNEQDSSSVRAVRQNDQSI